MITQPPTKPPASPKPNPNPPQKQQTLQKIQQITKLLHSKISNQIETGQVQLRKKPLHIQIDNPNPIPHRNLSQNPQRSIRQKINSLNSDLELLQKEIAMQRQEERSRDEAKRREAALMIERLKREKEEYRSRIRGNQMSNRLKSSVLSEDVIKQMRERRDSLIQEKKKDMEERIYKNLSRKAQRQQIQASNQINYWSKIKQIEDRKRHHSTKILPSIHRFNQNQSPQFGVNISGLQRKNSFQNKQNLLHKRSYSKQQLGSGLQYSDVVNKFLQRAKAKQAESKSQNSPNLKSRMITNQAISQKNQFSLGVSKITTTKNQKIQKIVASFIDNKAKLLGNQYLKQSLLKVDRSKSPRASTIINNSFAEQSLQLKGNPAILSRSNKITYLQQRRQKILHNLSTDKITKQLGIEMLGPVQSRLDKINPEGIQKRLKQKLQIFSQIQKRQAENPRERRLLIFQSEEGDQII